MGTTSVINGSLLILYVNNVAVGSATSHQLSLKMATRNITTKNAAGWTKKLGGIRDWTVSGDSLMTFDDTYGYSELFALYTARTSVTLRFSTEVSGDHFWEGTALLTALDQSAPMEENATFSFTFEGTDAIVEKSQT